jgi:Polysaccharide deacetylase
MSEFIHFADLEADHPATWRGKKILSIDIDWASDEVLADTITMVEEAGIKACFFVTHNTPLLLRLRANQRIELGLHPNFDPLLRGEGGGRTAAGIIEELRKVVPKARVLRSHAMTTSGRWLEVYRSAGITHLSNYIMYGVNVIQPFRHINGLLEAPVYFADDGYLYQEDRGNVTFDIGKNLTVPGEGLKVYNFHPIHIFLNSENLARYVHSIPVAHDTVELAKVRYTGEGARTWLARLISNGS